MVALKSPYPYFGGKAKVAPLLWERFGSVANYVDPFFGSGAALLAAPWPAERTETVNDLDGLLSNFWRALQADPEAVAYHADYPVNETDLHARHRWLVDHRESLTALLSDPDAYDAKAAGWWVWGISQWIGSGWCPVVPTDELWQTRPHLGHGASANRGANTGMGVHRGELHLPQKRPHMGGVNVNADGTPGKGGGGKGVHRLSLQMPAISAQDGGGERTQGIFRERNRIYAYFEALAQRLRRVRVCCGDYRRVLGPSVTWRHGLTAVFLDPPYAHSERQRDLYAADHDVFAAVKAWAVANGDNPLLRIAVAGYDDGEPWPDGWEVVHWKAAGGYGSQGEGRGRDNASRETLWFSPHCLNDTPLERLIKETTPC